MSDDEQTWAEAPLRMWWGYYGAGLLALIISWYIGRAINAASIPIAVYLATGFTLNRLILRNLTWNPLYNTISGVAKAKLSSFLLWPLSYLFLLIQMGINRVL